MADFMNEMRELAGMETLPEEDGEELREALGKGDSLRAHLERAEIEFLTKAGKGIKKLAGGKAESVEVSGLSIPMLVYRGQDKSDMDLEVTFSLGATRGRATQLVWYVDSVRLGSGIKEENMFPQIKLLPEILVNIFKNYFGV